MNVLLIVPPFGPIEFQSLGLHNLQALGREAGFNVDIYYANIHFASKIGPRYNSYCNMNYFLLGERLFARAAWEDKVEYLITEDIYNYSSFYNRDENPIIFFPPVESPNLEEIKQDEVKAYNWVNSFTRDVDLTKYKVIGVTSSFEQTNASISILKSIKKSDVSITTFIGGFNCEKNGAEGILSLDINREIIDYIFSGESEITFIDFLTYIDKKGRYNDRIIRGEPLLNLDIIPKLDYLDYFNQLKKWLPEQYNKSSKLLVMETSRGCWWGEKNQCKFCGTSDRIKYRVKSTERILQELEAAKKWNINYIHMADLIMPFNFKNSLLPILKESDDNWRFYYEEKVNLNYTDLKLLKDAGITDIQPGIESLSSNILKSMSKGIDLKQNIRFLRDSTYLDLNLFWNIVWGIPHETIDDYIKVNKLIKLIMHLIPPIGIFHMTLVKFSPYFNSPEQYGISNIEPLESYKKIYPKGVDYNKLAIIYKCDYKSETIKNSSEINNLINNIKKWKHRWDNKLNRPRLHICKKGDGEVVLLDTRDLRGNQILTPLKETEIENLMFNSPYSGSQIQQWAIKEKFAIEDKGYFIPLATVDEDIRNHYEK